MKKIILILLIIITSISFGGCFKIANPEDLLQTPALNEEKKEMKDAVDKFRPPNSVNYPVLLSGENKSVSMIIKDFDSDSTSEIVSFYKNKDTDKIGMFVLKKVDSLWIKKKDVEFNFYEISKVSIVDLNANNKKELVIEAYETTDKLNPRNYSIVYFTDKDVKIIKEQPFIVMNIFDINGDGKKEIISVNKPKANSDYLLDVDIFDKDKITNYLQRKLKTIKNPYNMSIGNIYNNHMAVFIDYMAENGYGNTDILLFEKETLSFLNLDEEPKYEKNNYQFNVQSKDIDNDGIIEVAYKFKAPNYSMPVEDPNEIGYVKGYFKIKKDYKLEIVKEIYEDPSRDFLINIPKTFRGKYTVNVSKDNLTTNINFVDHQGKEYPLIQINYIRKYKWQNDQDVKKDMQLISENQNYVIAGKVLDYSENLSGMDKKDYNQMRSDCLILTNITKE